MARVLDMDQRETDTTTPSGRLHARQRLGVEKDHESQVFAPRPSMADWSYREFQQLGDHWPICGISPD